MPAAKFGPYNILERIGSGGMGEVYRAMDTRLEREIAIKLVSDRFLADTSSSSPASPPSAAQRSPAHHSRERFLREARAAATLNHPNICAIYDTGEQDGQPYLVMELLRGETLRQYLRRNGTEQPLSPAEVIAFGLQIAGALAAAHDRGIIHRDIKPANLFVTAGDHGRHRIKVLDFGLAKRHDATAGVQPDLQMTSDASAIDPQELSSPGATVGTVAYMSPEQARGEALDARSDLFSLGVVMYEMATGRLPFEGASAAETFAALLMQEPPPVSSVNADMPAVLDRTIAQLLAKNRELRTQSAHAIFSELEVIHDDIRAHASHASGATSSAVIPAQTPSAPASRLPWLWTAGVVAAVFLLCGGFLAVSHFRAAKLLSNSNAARSPLPAKAKDAIILADFVNKTGDPVFDTTLDQALRVQLDQSPVLDIVSQQHLRRSLQYLGKKPDSVVTPEIAREIGQREGMKAILIGTIASVGSSYLITLDAQNAATGDDILTVDVTVEDKNHVLDSLNQLATQMRATLGESLASIQKLNAPFGQATTPSLEAFRAYALGDAAHVAAHNFPEAEGHYQRALELDPNLAMAYARLGMVYAGGTQFGKAIRYLTRAHELSANVSPPERLYIEGAYYSYAAGDLNKAIAIRQEAAQEYPLRVDNYVNLGALEATLGRFDQETTEAEKGLALQPENGVAMVDTMESYFNFDRLEEAQTYLDHAKQRGENSTTLLTNEIFIDALKGNMAGAQKILAELAGKPDEFTADNAYAGVLGVRGQFQAAEAMYRKATALAANAGARDAQAANLLNAASAEWAIGKCKDIEDAGRQAWALDRTKPTEIAMASDYALCGDAKDGLPLLAAIKKKYPQDTLVQEQYYPQGMAALALKAGRAQQAADLLQTGRSLDDVSPGGYLRGLAYLQLHDAPNAIAAFHSATHPRGSHYFEGDVYGLALLGLGRAYTMAGDKANARKAYDDFFVEWKDADPDLPVLAQAKTEHAAL